MGDYRKTFVEHFAFTLPILKDMPNKKHLIKDQKVMVERIINKKRQLTLMEQHNLKHKNKPYIEAEFKALMQHKEDMHKKGLTIYGNPLKR